MLSQIFDYQAKTKDKFHSFLEENDDPRIVFDKYQEDLLVSSCGWLLYLN